MKKILVSLLAVTAIVLSCSKTPEEGDNGNVDIARLEYQISMNDLPAEGPKVAWVTGDRIYVFFDDESTKNAVDASTLPYLKLEYNGNSWNIDDSKSTVVLPESGTLTAIHCPFSNAVPEFKDGAFYVGSPYTWCMYDMEVPYVTSSDIVRFALDMVVPEGVVDVQVPVEGLSADGVYAMKVSNDDKSAGLKPITTTFNPATGEVSIVEGNMGDDMYPLICEEQYIYCGKAIAPADGKMTFVINEKDEMGNNLENTYAYVNFDLFSMEGSIYTPILSSWVTPTLKTTTVLYEDGTLIINELPEDHIANALDHGAVILTHGKIHNLVPEEKIEQDPETGEILSTTFTLPWCKGYNQSNAKKGYETDGTGVPETNEWQMKIKHIEFGSELKPSIAKFSFAGLVNLESVDTRNLVISSDSFWKLEGTFEYCINLRTIDVSGWDMAKVDDMQFAFNCCKKLQALDVSKWNVSKLYRATALFRYCQSLEVLDVSQWSTPALTRMTDIFRGLVNVKELDLSNFDTSEVEQMDRLFYQCKNLEKIYASDKFVVNVASDRPFYQCEKLVGGAGTVWNENNVGADYMVIDSESKPGYFSSK